MGAEQLVIGQWLLLRIQHSERLNSGRITRHPHDDAERDCNRILACHIVTLSNSLSFGLRRMDSSVRLWSNHERRSARCSHRFCPLATAWPLGC